MCACVCVVLIRSQAAVPEGSEEEREEEENKEEKKKEERRREEKEEKMKQDGALYHALLPSISHTTHVNHFLSQKSRYAPSDINYDTMNTHALAEEALALVLAATVTVLVSSLDCPGIAVCLAVPAVVVYGPQELFTSMVWDAGMLKLLFMKAIAASSLRTSFIRTFYDTSNTT